VQGSSAEGCAAWGGGNGSDHADWLSSNQQEGFEFGLSFRIGCVNEFTAFIESNHQEGEIHSFGCLLNFSHDLFCVVNNLFSVVAASAPLTSISVATAEILR